MHRPPIIRSNKEIIAIRVCYQKKGEKRREGRGKKGGLGNRLFASPTA